MVPLSTGELISKTLNAYEYACELQRTSLASRIDQQSKLDTYEKRYLNVLEKNDVARCNEFIHRLRNQQREHDTAQRGFFYAAQLGSIRLLDNFLREWKLDIDCQTSNNGYSTTALLTALEFKQNGAAKFLLLHSANPFVKGQFENALVAALHYQSSNELLRILLDKNVDLSARHPEYPNQNLRGYCVLTNRVQAKEELDKYIIRLIKLGDCKRLERLVKHGYTDINVKKRRNRTARQLAHERYEVDIVLLMDSVEKQEKQARVKMNY
jgi:ankyrin repeat protein